MQLYSPASLDRPPGGKNSHVKPRVVTKAGIIWDGDGLVSLDAINGIIKLGAGCSLMDFIRGLHHGDDHLVFWEVAADCRKL